ncbi:hypothetical protein CMI37_23310 [Candidatus Pacearchaeota archaeon]|nr:hypothetical protein [Candidatus Pacearchaeota archaeon]
MATYSGKQFKVAVGLHTSNLGLATLGGTMYYLRVDSINDIDFSAGYSTAVVERTGQRVIRPSDHITAHSSTNAAGGEYTWAWDNYVPENEALFHALITSLTETADVTSTEKIIGTAATNTYDTGAASSFALALQILSPDASKGRYMYGAIVQDMTMSWDAGTNGGKMTTSGTLYSGYRPIIYDNSGITVNATAVAQGGWNLDLFQMDAITIGGNAVICKAFSVTISNPAKRVGNEAITEASPGSAGVVFGQPEEYMRGGLIDVTGSITVKMDDNTIDLLNNWQRATSTAILFGDHATIGSATCHINIEGAKLTGFNKDYAAEDGVFIEIPFQGTADGANSLIDWKIT